MKALLISLFLTAAAQADLSFPNLSEDHQPVDLTNPSIGAEILSIPGSVWFIGFNDDFGNTDPDYNDAVAIMEFNGPMTAKLHYILALSSYHAVLRLAFHGDEPFLDLGGTAHYKIRNDGHAVTIEMLTSNGNTTYFTGGPILNPDSKRHAFVSRIK